MNLPKKNSRGINIRDVQYRWMVGKALYEWPMAIHIQRLGRAWVYVTLPLVIVTADGKSSIRALFEGQKLLAVPELGFDDLQTIAISPGVVGEVIEYALDRRNWGQSEGQLVLNDAQFLFASVFLEPELARMDCQPEHLAVYHERLVEARVQRQLASTDQR